MLKYLHIQNLILIQSANIEFVQGFNVLSGETGSGKSAIMEAINLIAGQRADTTVIRHGSDKSIIEAVFDIENIPEIKKLLEEAGIDHAEKDDLIIRREVAISGKSRAFINNQSAQISLLGKVCSLLMEITGQHANQSLFSIDHHRSVVDKCGHHEKTLGAFAKSWEKETSLRHQIDNLVSNEAQRLREMETCRLELEELHEANIKEDEDEELFSEYTLLANSENLSQKVGEINQMFSGEKIAVLSHMTRQKTTFDQLLAMDASLAEAAKTYYDALMELQEVAHTLRNYQSSIEYNPEKLNEINERLSLITRLKRKYGPTVLDVHEYMAKTEAKLAALERADLDIEALQESLKEIEAKSNALSAELSNLRKSAAIQLKDALIPHLRSLNMPKADFHIEITHQKRNATGDDRIEFFLVPNVGEKQIAIRDCASGGELSRIMLALHTLLARIESLPTLIFDEVDANIGGETAVVVGEKLKNIGATTQVIAITHFPQVARQADHHVQISKIEKDGRTVTIVADLDAEGRERELTRMLGGTSQMELVH